MKRTSKSAAALLVIFTVAAFVQSETYADGNKRASHQQRSHSQSKSSRGGQKTSSKSSHRGGNKSAGKTTSQRVWGDPHVALSGHGASGNRKSASGQPSAVQRKWIPLEGIEHFEGKNLFSHSDEQRNALRPGAPTPREAVMPWGDDKPGGGATGLFSHADEPRSGFRSGVLTPREAATGSLTTRSSHQTTSRSSLPTQESNEGGGIWNSEILVDFDDFESRRHILQRSTSQFGKGRGTPSASAFVDSVRTAREKGSALRKNK